MGVTWIISNLSSGIHSHYNAVLFFKKIKMSTFSGDSAECWAVTISSAGEKTHSLGSDVPWAVRYSLANLALI